MIQCVLMCAAKAVGGLLLLVVAYFFYLWARLPTPKSLGIPGPHPVPVFGVLFKVIKNFDRLYDMMYDDALKYNTKGTHCVSGLRTAITLLEPEDIKHVLHDNFDNYVKPAKQKVVLRELLGEGIFNVDGEPWRIQRKSYSHMFSEKNLRNMYHESMFECGEKIANRIGRYSKDGEAFDIQNLFFRATFDAICLIAFGQHVGCLDSDDKNAFQTAFDSVTAHAIRRTTNPVWKLLRLYGSEHEKQFERDIATLNAFSYELIGKRRELLRDEPDRKTFDVLSVCIRIAQNKGETLLDVDLRDIAMNIILAGRDTTAVVLSWLFYELALNQDMQDKARQEIRKLTGGPDGHVNFSNVDNLKYMEALIYETLRLHPSVPGDVKHALKEDKLPKSGYTIPAGADINYSPFIMGRWPGIWKDPLKFLPSRWEEPECIAMKLDPYRFIAFNAGPRLCLGKKLATVEAKAFAAAVLNKYKIELVPGQNITYNISITMNIKDALMVKASLVD